MVVHAWDDKNLNVTKTVDEITKCLYVFCGFFNHFVEGGTCRFHPDFYDGKSKVQSMMLGYMHKWVEDFGHKKKSVLDRLTKESVREHKNVLREGETGVSQALVNPFRLPTLEDLTTKRSPGSVNSAAVGAHEGSPIYYGKRSDRSHDMRETGSPPPYASPYPPSSVDSEASSQDQQRYMWTPGSSREGEHCVSDSTKDFYSFERSSSLPTTSKPYDPPLGPPLSTKVSCSATSDQKRSVTEGYAPQRLGLSQATQNFYSSPGPTPRQMSSQPQSHGMDFYAQGSQHGSYLQYDSHSPQTPHISREAASFYPSSPPQIPQLGSPWSGEEGQTDPLAELTANLRKF